MYGWLSVKKSLEQNATHIRQAPRAYQLDYEVNQQQVFEASEGFSRQTNVVNWSA